MFACHFYNELTLPDKCRGHEYIRNIAGEIGEDLFLLWLAGSESNPPV